jgi:NADPH:quinone reductase-like Zn-dependent oxidoreductase
MKAAFITKYGGPDVMQYGELPDPILQNNKIIIQVKAVSINPVDYKVRQGAMKILTGRKFPKLLGHDFSGIVKEISNEIIDFKTGDKIYGYVPVLFGKTGAMAEYIQVSANQIRKIPDGISFEEAASLPVGALTALNGLIKLENLSGKKVLVNGATGGVGHFAVQIAKAYGATVTATCSTKNIELAKQLGADEILDYTKEDVAKLNTKFDFVFDAFGKINLETVCKLLNKKGVYVSTLPSPGKMISSLFVQIAYSKKLASANMRSKPEDYQKLEKIILEKKLKPLIENTYDLKNVRQAFDMAENGKPRGKVIVTI